MSKIKLSKPHVTISQIQNERKIKPDRKRIRILDNTLVGFLAKKRNDRCVTLKKN